MNEETKKVFELYAPFTSFLMENRLGYSPPFTKLKLEEEPMVDASEATVPPREALFIENVLPLPIRRSLSMECLATAIELDVIGAILNHPNLPSIYPLALNCSFTSRVKEMMEVSRSRDFRGPWVVLARDLQASKCVDVLGIEGVIDVLSTSGVPKNRMVLVQLTSDVVRLVIAKEPKKINNTYVCSIVPQVRADFHGNVGVVIAHKG